MSQFRMKQFSIVQDRAAMKVGTDSLLLGSWAEVSTPHTALDIGAGTGILSLMLAQRYPDLEILAVELDQEATLDARENIDTSPFAQRIQLIQADIHQFVSALPHHCIDLIISNPPYYEATLIAPNLSRATARHEGVGGLTLENLMLVARQLLSPNGCFCLISPVDRLDDLRRYATQNLLYPDLITKVYSSPSKEVRILSRWRPLHLQTPYQATSYSGLIIRDDEGNYTPEYKTLVAPYLITL